MPRKKAKQSAPQCLMPECTRDANGARGLCVSCYNTARVAVAGGETTWSKLEKAGLVRAPHSVPRSPASKAIKEV